MRVFERWYLFWLVLKLEISYNRVIIIFWRILVSFRRFFEDYYFCMVKYLSFHNSSFALRYIFKVNDTPPCGASSPKLCIKIRKRYCPSLLDIKFSSMGDISFTTTKFGLLWDYTYMIKANHMWEEVVWNAAIFFGLLCFFGWKCVLPWKKKMFLVWRIRLALKGCYFE